MRRKEVVDALVSRTGCTPEQINKVLDALMDIIGTSLAKGGKFSLRNFGSFEATYRRPQERNHPQNGIRMKIPGYFAIKFHAAEHLKSVVNG